MNRINHIKLLGQTLNYSLHTFKMEIETDIFRELQNDGVDWIGSCSEVSLINAIQATDVESVAYEPQNLSYESERSLLDIFECVRENTEADFYVQTNGDKPRIKPYVIYAIISDSIPDDMEFATNIITDAENVVQVTDPSNIKIIFHNNMRVFYMSRTPTTYPFKSIGFKYHKHVGVIGYNKKTLNFYENTECRQFESVKELDLMRLIEYAQIIVLCKFPERRCA